MSQYEDFLARRQAKEQAKAREQQERQVFVVTVEMDAFTTWAMQIGKRERARLALAA